MIKAIFFDFSETLVHGSLNVDACRTSVVELLCSKGYKVSREQYNSAMEQALNLRRIAKLEGRETSFEKMGAVTLSLLKIEPTRQLLSEIEELEFRQYTWSVLSGVRKTLEDLAKHFKLAIISNSASGSVTRVLKKEDLCLFFDEVILSRDVGFRKPDTRIFERALTILGVQAENALYVGDSFAQDVLGAKRSGMKTIWLTKRRDIEDSNFDGVAHSISDVPRIVTKLQELEDKFESKDQIEAASSAQTPDETIQT